MAAAPTPSQTAGTTTTYLTMGIAPGDGDLMLPSFNGDRKTDAEEWLQDLLDYMVIRKVPKTTATVLLYTHPSHRCRTQVAGERAAGNELR